MVVLAFMDFRGLRNYRQHIYFGILGLILLLFIVGAEAKGSTRWIPLGFFNLQPSEVAKVGMIVVLAAFLSDRTRGELEIADHPDDAGHRRRARLSGLHPA